MVQDENDYIEAISQLTVAADEGAHSLSTADAGLTDGAAERIDDEHLGAGFGDGVLEQFVAVLGVDGRQIVADEKRDELSAFLARAELVHGMTLEDGFFVGAPEHGTELGTKAGKGLAARDCEAESGSKVGFAGLGLAGEEAERSTGEDALDDIGKVLGEDASGFDTGRLKRVLERADGVGVGIAGELRAAHRAVNDVHHLYGGENCF